MTVAVENEVGACINKLFMILAANESSLSYLFLEVRKFPFPSTALWLGKL